MAESPLCVVPQPTYHRRTATCYLSINKADEVAIANYLVTGGCGFTGSYLADSLIADTIVDGAAVARALDGMDGCFHLAAIASVQCGVED